LTFYAECFISVAEDPGYINDLSRLWAMMGWV
jgi:hypothetical protein